ncbi:FHA domain-containing protein [Streptomyces sp. LX-29]|uniref:FHA domain-containing protein n=1 Tax=Streptomyces sp. LX-29 TaxID=2900152 RepID=UPI00240D95B1|nr:FHA domain-containing protein [Streptomyces sp. LX-29]WFB09546.1 FHA domain-containing protein [Streptomyces sp. LX-29]
MATCPNGHQSTADDWCEVCGHRMSGTPMPAGSVPPPPPPPLPMPGAPLAPVAPGGAPGPHGGPGAPGGPAPGDPGAPDVSGFPGMPGMPGTPGVPGAPGVPGVPGVPGAHGQLGAPAAPAAPGGYGYPGSQPPAPAGGYGYPGPQQSDATVQAELCPQCRTPREAQAPFCEECRYNFLTQSASPYIAPPAPPAQGGFPPAPQPPAPPRPSPGQPPHPHVPAQATHGGGDYPGSHPSQVNRPAEPLTGPQSTGGAYGVEDDWPLPPPGGGPVGAAAPAPPVPPAPAPAPAPGPVPSPYQPPQAPAPAPPAPMPAAPVFGGDDFPGAGSPQPPAQPQPPQPAAPFQPAAPPAPAGWVAVVAPDREYFMAMMHRSGPEAAGLNLPAYSPDQHIQLTGNQVTIGRRRHSTGESPDIDLARPPEDPGVSHQHAVFVQQPDGSWAVVDQNSTNGTTINGAEDPIQPYVPVPLQDGDRVHVGAWTTITVRRG